MTCVGPAGTTKNPVQAFAHRFSGWSTRTPVHSWPLLAAEVFVRAHVEGGDNGGAGIRDVQQHHQDRDVGPGCGSRRRYGLHGDDQRGEGC